MTLLTRAAGKASAAATIYTNVGKEVTGNEVQAAINDLWDSALLTEDVWFFEATSSRPPYVAGFWYPTGDDSVAAGAAPGANLICAYPFFLVRSVTISDLAAKVITTHAANNFQLAIYANNPATNRPTGSELAKTGNISTASAAVVSADIIGANVVLAAGLYWACVNTSSASATFNARPISSGRTAYLIGSATLGDMSGASLVASITVTTPVTFNTWGDLSSAPWTKVFTAITAALYFKVA